MCVYMCVYIYIYVYIYIISYTYTDHTKQSGRTKGTKWRYQGIRGKGMEYDQHTIQTCPNLKVK